jgi:hypothetical protein
MRKNTPLRFALLPLSPVPGGYLRCVRGPKKSRITQDYSDPVDETIAYSAPSGSTTVHCGWAWRAGSGTASTTTGSGSTYAYVVEAMHALSPVVHDRPPPRAVRELTLQDVVFSASAEAPPPLPTLRRAGGWGYFGAWGLDALDTTPSSRTASSTRNWPSAM